MQDKPMDIHETVHEHEAKVDAKLHGRAGRWRGKAKLNKTTKRAAVS